MKFTGFDNDVITQGYQPQRRTNDAALLDLSRTECQAAEHRVRQSGRRRPMIADTQRMLRHRSGHTLIAHSHLSRDAAGRVDLRSPHVHVTRSPQTAALLFIGWREEAQVALAVERDQTKATAADRQRRSGRLHESPFGAE